MRKRIGWMLACAAALSMIGPLWSQPIYAPASDGGDHSTNDTPRAHYSRRSSARRPRPIMVQVPGTDKQTIEAYLQGRLARLQKANHEQEGFGRRLSGSWDDFWTKVFKERKLFEVRLARQRLDLFDSLGSLDPASHSTAISNFEKLQDSEIKAFEDGQRQKMDDFFARTLADIKDCSVDQEKQRQDFMEQSLDAWQTQKSASASNGASSARAQGL